MELHEIPAGQRRHERAIVAGWLGLAATSGGKREGVPGFGDALGLVSPHERRG